MLVAKEGEKGGGGAAKSKRLESDALRSSVACLIMRCKKTKIEVNKLSKAEIVLEKMYYLGFGQFSGVLLREELMRKVAKLRAKQIHEMKKLLASNLDLLEVEQWTLANIDDEQHVVIYYNKNDSNEKKLNRINVLDDALPIEYKDIVVAVDGEDWRERQEAAEDTFIKHVTGENLIRKET